MKYIVESIDDWHRPHYYGIDVYGNRKGLMDIKSAIKFDTKEEAMEIVKMNKHNHITSWLKEVND